MEERGRLKPCPFCGGKPVIYKSMPGRKAWIVCSGCGATSSYSYSEKTAIEAWNKRINNDND